jgi:hypothetical protein
MEGILSAVFLHENPNRASPPPFALNQRFGIAALMTPSRNHHPNM